MEVPGFHSPVEAPKNTSISVNAAKYSSKSEGKRGRDLMANSDDIQKIVSLKNDIKDLRSELNDKVGHLLSLCEELDDLCGKFESFDLLLQRDYSLVKDFDQYVRRDFRVPEKVERSITNLENELYREAEDGREIDELLKEIEKM